MTSSPTNLASIDFTNLDNFADGFPLLVITQSALDELNEKLDTPVPMTVNKASVGWMPYQKKSG